VEYTVDADADGVAVKEDVAEANNEDEAVADSEAAVDVELLADAVPVTLPIAVRETELLDVVLGDTEPEDVEEADEEGVCFTEFDALCDVDDDNKSELDSVGVGV
jgi:hypothetical protein